MLVACKMRPRWRRRRQSRQSRKNSAGKIIFLVVHFFIDSSSLSLDVVAAYGVGLLGVACSLLGARVGGWVGGVILFTFDWDSYLLMARSAGDGRQRGYNRQVTHLFSWIGFDFPLRFISLHENVSAEQREGCWMISRLERILFCSIMQKCSSTKAVLFGIDILSSGYTWIPLCGVG